MARTYRPRYEVYESRDPTYKRKFEEFKWLMTFLKEEMGMSWSKISEQSGYRVTTLTWWDSTRKGPSMHRIDDILEDIRDLARRRVQMSVSIFIEGEKQFHKEGEEGYVSMLSLLAGRGYMGR